MAPPADSAVARHFSAAVDRSTTAPSATLPIVRGSNLLLHLHVCQNWIRSCGFRWSWNPCESGYTGDSTPLIRLGVGTSPGLWSRPDAGLGHSKPSALSVCIPYSDRDYRVALIKYLTLATVSQFIHVLYCIDNVLYWLFSTVPQSHYLIIVDSENSTCLGDASQPNQKRQEWNHGDEELFPRSQQGGVLVDNCCDEPFQRAKLFIAK